MHTLMAELERRWQAMFDALAAGQDLPPGQRLRTEGMMEAALLLDAASEAQLLAAMESCYRKAFGRDIRTDFGADWRAFFPFPQIPAMARRAPVYPSTTD